MKKLISALVITFFVYESFAQNKMLDSLKMTLEKTQADSNKANILNELGKLVVFQDPAQAQKYAQEAEDLSKKINFLKGEASAYVLKAVVAHNNAKYIEAIELLKKALPIREKIGDKEGVANCYNNLGNNFYKQGDFVKSIESHFASLKIREAAEDKKGILNSYNNIGLVYDAQKDLKKAQEYYEKALKISLELGDKGKEANILANLAAIYASTDKGKALETNQKVAKIREEIQDLYGLSSTYRSIAEGFIDKNDLEKAQEYLEKSINLSKEVENLENEAVSYATLGDLFEKQKQYQKALEAHKKGYDIALEIGAKNIIRDILKDLKENYAEVGDFKKAYEMSRLFIAYSDSLANEDKSKAIGKLEGKFELEMKLEKERIAREKAEEEERKEQERSNNLQYSGILLALMFVFFAVIGFARTTLKPSTVESIVFFILLIFFEFILVFLDPFIEKYTNGLPILTLSANVFVAIMFMPMHRLLEKTLKKRLTKEKYEARLGIDIE